MMAVMHRRLDQTKVTQKRDLNLSKATYSHSLKSSSQNEHFPLPKRFPPVGFKNCGNTCYANAALQCILSTVLSRALLEPKCIRIIRKYSWNYSLLGENPARGDGDDIISKAETCQWLTHQLTQLCKEYTADPEESVNIFKKMGLLEHVIDPGNITRHVSRLSGCLHLGRQEDAHEFLRALISTLVMDGHNKELSALFDGLLESAVTCQTCGNCSLTRDRYMDLSLEISHSRTRTLHDAISQFMKTELLSKENMVTCEKCNAKRVVTKGLRLATAPTILVFHLKRFMFDEYGRTSRISKDLKFPLVLEIKQFMSKANRSVPPTYELVGVLVHQGQTSNCGHYLSYVKSQDRWYRASDNHIVQVSVEQVLKQKAYILMYEVKGVRNHKIPCTSSMIDSNIAPSLRDSNSWVSTSTNHNNQLDKSLDPCASLLSFFDDIPLCANNCFGMSNSATVDYFHRCNVHPFQDSQPTLENIISPFSNIFNPIDDDNDNNRDSNIWCSGHRRGSSGTNLIEVCKQAASAYEDALPKSALLNCDPYDVPRRERRRSRSLNRHPRTNVSNTFVRSRHRIDSRNTSPTQRGSTLPPRRPYNLNCF